MIDEIIDRVQELVTGLKLVGGAADFQSAAETNPKVTPAAFVFPMEENPQPSQVASSVMQQVRVSLGVVIVVRNLKDNKGVAARQDLDTLRRAMREALLGWVPTPDLDPLERGPGRLLTFRDGHMWWQDIYQSVYYDRSVL